jgi:AcrR family transcriptional regulator
MEEIAEAAGVSKPLIYQHFSSKRALYLELAASIGDELISSIQSAIANATSAREQVEHGLAAYFEVVGTHPITFGLLYGRDHDGDEELGRALRSVEDALAQLLAPFISADIDDEHRQFLAYSMVGMAEGASRHWLATTATKKGASKQEALHLARRLATVTWAGLRALHSE